MLQKRILNINIKSDLFFGLYNYQLKVNDSLVSNGILECNSEIKKKVELGVEEVYILLEIVPTFFAKNYGKARRFLGYIIYGLLNIFLNQNFFRSSISDVNPYEYKQNIIISRGIEEINIDILLNRSLFNNKGNGIQLIYNMDKIKESYLELKVNKQFLKENRNGNIMLYLFLDSIFFFWLVIELIKRDNVGMLGSGIAFIIMLVFTSMMIYVNNKTEKKIERKNNLVFRK